MDPRIIPLQWHAPVVTPLPQYAYRIWCVVFNKSNQKSSSNNHNKSIMINISSLKLYHIKQTILRELLLTLRKGACCRRPLGRLGWLRLGTCRWRRWGPCWAGGGPAGGTPPARSWACAPSSCSQTGGQPEGNASGAN